MVHQEPGPGVGGHCIPADPIYLAWKAQQHDFHLEFVELAGKINRDMIFRVVDWIAEALNGESKSIKGPGVLIVGVAHKEDVADTRESPALKVMVLLAFRGAEVSYHDSFGAEIEIDSRRLNSVALSRELLEDADCTVILTAHSDLDREMFASIGTPAVDTRNWLGRGSRSYDQGGAVSGWARTSTREKL